MYFSRKGDISYFAVINTNQENIVLQTKKSGDAKVFGCTNQFVQPLIRKANQWKCNKKPGDFVRAFYYR